MALTGLKMGLALVLATALWAGVSAQTGCTPAIISLSPCLNYITGNSSTPSSSCCTQLSSVVTNQAQCLCAVLNGGGSLPGLNLNQTQALALPGACNVKTPPLSQCNGKLYFALTWLKNHWDLKMTCVLGLAVVDPFIYGLKIKMDTISPINSFESGQFRSGLARRFSN